MKQNEACIGWPNRLTNLSNTRNWWPDRVPH